MVKKVLKFGGTSVGTVDRIQHVAKIIKKECTAGNKIIVVVSAMAGQTNNLRRRIYQHKETQSTKSTKGKEAKLVWFAPVNSRDSAVKAECELKKTIDNNPSKIDEKIIAFRDLVNELYLGE